MHFNLVPPISSSQFKWSPTLSFYPFLLFNVGREPGSFEWRITHCPCRIASYYYTIIIPIIVIPSNNITVTPWTFPYHGSIPALFSTFFLAFFPRKQETIEKNFLLSLARSHSRNIIQRAAMKRGEATPSRTPILRRLSTKILSYRFARTINSSFIARDPYGVSIRTWSFSTATKWFKNIRLYIYTLCIICLHTPPCRFNLLTFPRGRDGAAFIFFFFFSLPFYI